MSIAPAVLAMANAGYIAVGWLVTVGLIGGYSLLTLRKGRRLSAQVPEEDRRWS